MISGGQDPANGVTISGVPRSVHVIRPYLLLAAVGAAIMLVFAPRFAIMALVLGLAALGLFARKSVVAFIRWRPPTLIIPTSPAPLGGDLEVTYRRRPRAIRDLPSSRVLGHLVCEEEITYRQGTDTKTDTEEVFRRELILDGDGTPRGFEATGILSTPHASGGPTIDLGNSRVRWFVEARMDAPGLPVDEWIFPIEVGPVLDPAVRQRLGDG